MKKYLLILFLILGLFVTSLVWADVMNPEYLTKHCPLNKVEKECSYTSEIPFGPTTFTDCDSYKNNPECQYLVGHGSSFGGQERYCCEPSFENASHLYVSQIKLFGLNLLLTLLLELPVFWLFGFRKKKEIFVITLANLLSVSTFYIASFWLSGYIFVFISELVIIIFEILFLVKVLKGINIKKIIIATIVANIISAIIGGILINSLSFIGLIK